MNSKTFIASTLALAHLSTAVEVTPLVRRCEQECVNHCNWVPTEDPDPHTMQKLAGRYVWKHDGQNISGDMTLHEDGTLE